VLLVVHAGADLASTTVNLRAPIVVNIGTSRAAQVILDDVSLPVAAPLLGDGAR
jgi:flagellar assembly factor FliW